MGGVAFERAFRRRGKVVIRPDKPYPMILLDKTWAAPEQHLSSRRRSDLRRARRRAERLGTVTFSFHQPAPGELPELLAAALDVEAASWKGRRGTAMKIDSVCGPFFENYAMRAAQAGLLRVQTMTIGGQPAAMHLAVVCGERFWLLKMGYDDRFARCSPGTLLLAESVRRAAEQGLQSYELLGSTEAWTRVWTQTTRPCVALHAYPANWRGLSRLAADGAHYGRRKVSAALRTGSFTS